LPGSPVWELPVESVAERQGVFMDHVAKRAMRVFASDEGFTLLGSRGRNGWTRLDGQLHCPKVRTQGRQRSGPTVEPSRTRTDGPASAKVASSIFR
jgi:hypothetical protein